MMFLKVMEVNYILWLIVNITYIPDRNIGHFLKLALKEKVLQKKLGPIELCFYTKQWIILKVVFMEVMKEFYNNNNNNNNKNILYL